MELKSGLLLRVLLFLMILGFSYIHSLSAAPLSRSLKLANDEGPLTEDQFENQVQVMRLNMGGGESNYHAGSRELMVVEVETSYDYHTGANNHHDPKHPEH